MGAEQQPVQRTETPGIPRRVVLRRLRDLGILVVTPTVLLRGSETKRDRLQTPINPLFAPQSAPPCETVRTLVLPHSLPIPDQIEQLFTNAAAWNPVRADFELWKQVTARQHQGIDLLYSLGATLGYPQDTPDSLQQAETLAEKLIREASRRLGIEYSSEPYLFFDPTRQSKPDLAVVANAYVC